MSINLKVVDSSFKRVSILKKKKPKDNKLYRKTDRILINQYTLKRVQTFLRNTRFW